MPRLSHVLSALMAEVASARQIADEYTICIAKRYRDDPLLRAMSVPRIRLPELVVNLPLMVEQVSESDSKQVTAESAVSGTQAFLGAAEQVLLDLGKTPDQVTEDERLVAPPRLEVLVAADQLKAQAAANGGNLMHLKLTLREEALEWSSDAHGSERGGEVTSRLIPE